MANLNDGVASGIVPVGSQQLNLEEAPVIRKRVTALDRSMSKETFASFQKGEFTPPMEHMTGSYTPDSAIMPPTTAPPPPAATYTPSPNYQPAPGQTTIPLPVQAPAAPGQPPAPTSTSYPPRVNDRINKIWGEKMQANEYAQRLEAQLIETNRRLETMMGSRAPAAPAPYSNQYGSHPETPSNGSPQPAGDFISRQEMQAILEGERRASAEASTLSHAHTLSRLEAEKDFPDVFGNPEVFAQAERIWATDPFLRKDPNGPIKAAALARAFSGPALSSAPSPAEDVRKLAISSVGPSLAQGSGQPVVREDRYRQALAYARYTQQPADFVRARNIQLGLE